MAYSGQLVMSGLREFQTRSSDILLQVYPGRRSRLVYTEVDRTPKGREGSSFVC